jgi:orotidine-5'-phosphate decarboxylase
VVVALDCSDVAQALALADRLDPALCRVKVGQELFTRAGPRLASTLIDHGFAVFLDLKFHDIPNTVEGACRAAADLGVWMLNVHALGGRRMLEAARRAVPDGPGQPLLVAVTVLTSLADRDFAELGISSSPGDRVLGLARLAAESGLDGVVCSAHEVGALRPLQPEGRSWTLVTPGIRPAGSPTHDQRRVMTPAQALRAGADYLVIGRPITEAPDPAAALEQVVATIAQAS